MKESSPDLTGEAWKRTDLSRKKKRVLSTLLGLWVLHLVCIIKCNYRI